MDTMGRGEVAFIAVLRGILFGEEMNLFLLMDEG